jgi:hypothetical protein
MRLTRRPTKRVGSTKIVYQSGSMPAPEKPIRKDGFNRPSEGHPLTRAQVTARSVKAARKHAKWMRERKKILSQASLTIRTSEGTRVRIHNGLYTDAIAKKICQKIMLKYSLTRICKDPRMPNINTVAGWLADPRMATFREMYYHARRVAAEMYVDEIFEIADDGRDDWIDKLDADGRVVGQTVNNEAVQRAKLKVDARKWFASKMVPRLYGENSTVALDATGDLAQLLRAAANKDKGLPPPIEHEG